MKYWLLSSSIEGLQVYSEIKVDYSNKIVFLDATKKEGNIDGSFDDDYPFFSGILGEPFSKRLVNEVLKINPEGIIIIRKRNNSVISLLFKIGHIFSSASC